MSGSGIRRKAQGERPESVAVSPLFYSWHTGGVSFLIELKSPVSHTTIVIVVSCSNSVCAIGAPWVGSLRSLSNDIDLECVKELLENGDLGADLGSRLGIAHRAQALVDRDVRDRGNDVGVVGHRGLGALEVVVLRQVDPLGVEHQRETLVTVRSGERAVDRDRAARPLDRRITQYLHL